MSYKKIQKEILKFRNDRDWKQFHTPKNLAISIAIEAGELLENFQWKTEAEIEALKENQDLEEIKDEIADIANYLLLLCDDLDIDLIEAMEQKMIKNGLKYPIDKAKGNATKYDKL